MLLSATLLTNFVLGSDATQSRASLRRRYVFGSEFCNVQFINFPTWFRGFHDKLEN